MKEEQIIQSARELFEQYGIKKTSMDEIAQRAGVTKKTVYSYFKSKSELINYFLKEELKNMKDIVQKYSSREEEFFKNVHEGLYELLSYKKKSFFINLIIREQDYLDTKELKESTINIDNEIKLFIKQILEKAISNGYIVVNNVDIVTFLIYKMYIALMFEWNKDYSKLTDTEIADSILQILKNGLSAENNRKE